MTALAKTTYTPHSINAHQIRPGNLITLDHFYGMVEVLTIKPITEGPVGYDAPWTRTYDLSVRVALPAPPLDPRAIPLSPSWDPEGVVASSFTLMVSRFGGEPITRWEAHVS